MSHIELSVVLGESKLSTMKNFGRFVYRFIIQNYRSTFKGFSLMSFKNSPVVLSLNNGIPFPQQPDICKAAIHQSG